MENVQFDFEQNPALQVRQNQDPGWRFPLPSLAFSDTESALGLNDAFSFSMGDATELAAGFQGNAPIIPAENANVINQCEVGADPPESHGPRTRVRISEEEWNKRKSDIKDYYIRQNFPLSKTIEAMAEKGFHASERKYKEKLKEWGFEKNINSRCSKFIRKKTKSRRAQNKPKTQFLIHGKAVPAELVERHLQNPCHSDISTSGNTPSAILYRTPQLSPVSIVRAHPISQAIVPVEWEGMNIDALTALRDRSIEDAWAEDHEAFHIALPGILRSIDGLEALMGPTHRHTVNTLRSLALVAQHHGQIDEAEGRLLKSLEDHHNSLGPNDGRTIECMAQIGLFYRSFNRLAEAEKFLAKALKGLENASHSPENTFLRTDRVTQILVEIAISQRNFIEAENLLNRRIAEAQSLGPTYLDREMWLKHDLAHLYCKKEWREAPDDEYPRKPMRGALRQILAQLVDHSEAQTFQIVQTTSKVPDDSLCPWVLLLSEYCGEVDQAPLGQLCERIEHLIDRVKRISTKLGSKMILLQTKLSQAYAELGFVDTAEWWLIHLQSEIDRSDSYGPTSPESLDTAMHHALLFLHLGNWQRSDSLLREAQEKATEILPKDDPLHARIARCLETRKWEASCTECGIR